MSHIQVLPKDIAQRIAAGEVVERPASVVKELLENAIDAGAQAITLEIENGGIRYIRVTDDGCGIAYDDVPRAFFSHATSKIRTADDLDAIGTLGFRGEALASVAAVARVELLTRQQGSQTGTRYTITGGEAETHEEAGCPEGTTIVVRDLFFNTPARMKFLKKDVSEANAVAAVVDRIALSHPEIRFRFIREGKQTLLTPGDGELLGAVRAIFGKAFAQDMLPVDCAAEGVQVSGYVSKPAASRPNRNMQYFFVNGRLIKTATGAAALSEAYKNTVMAGKFPACVLHISLPGEQVDVNVHPAKIEVRFAREKSVFQAIYYGVKQALAAGDLRADVAARTNANPAAHTTPATKGDQLHFQPKKPDFWQNISVQDLYGKPQEKTPSASLPIKSTPADIPAVQADIPDLLGGNHPQPVVLTCKGDDLVVEVDDPAEALPQAPMQPKQEVLADSPLPQELTAEPAPAVQVVGEAFATYIIVQQGDALLLIDKHAAHERILYERLKSTEGKRSAQVLLSPEVVTLSKEEYAAVLENRDLFSQAGFDVEDFGDGMVVVRECPMELAADDISDLIGELAGQLLAHKQELLPEKLDWIYHSVSCRAAVKAGDFTTPLERERFVEQLLRMPDIRYCPHGRPVLFTITRGELEKRFGRLQ